MIMVILNVVNCRLGCVAEDVLRRASSTLLEVSGIPLYIVRSDQKGRESEIETNTPRRPSNRRKRDSSTYYSVRVIQKGASEAKKDNQRVVLQKPIRK
jgi:hypothetical protein